MKILLLAPSLERGGSERFISNLSLALSPDHQITVALFENRVDYPVGGETVCFALPPKKNPAARIFNVLRRCLAMKKLLRKERPDVVLSVMKAGNRVNALCARKGVRRFVSCRGFADLQADPRSFLKAAAGTDGVIFNSMECRETFCRQYGGPRDKTFYNYNLIDFHRIKAGLAEPIGDPSLEAFLQTHRCIACMGRLSEVKGQRELIRAFELLAPAVPDSALVLIGGNGAQKEEIAALASRSPFRERIFLAGDRDNPYPILAACHVYALPSKAEGFPNALIEAMACGLCAVAADCRTGPGEILRGCVTEHLTDRFEIADFGVLTPPPAERPDLFAEALEILLTDGAFRDTLSRAARKRAAEFTTEQALKDFLEIISGKKMQ